MRPIARFAVSWWILVGVACAVGATYYFVGAENLDRWLGLQSSRQVLAAEASWTEEVDVPWVDAAEEVYREIKAHRTKSAIESLASFRSVHSEDPRTKDFIEWCDLQIAIELGDLDKIEQYLDVAAIHANADPMLVNNAAWMIWLAYEKDADLDNELIHSALTASQLVLPQAKRESNPAYLLDTIAHLEFALGNVSKAIQAQSLAVQSAQESAEKDSMRRFLKSLLEIQKKNEDQNAD